MQGQLFDTSEPGRNQYGYPIEPRDPHLDEAEKPRLSAQCRAILDRLRKGPATNTELSGIALKYTGRISDLRAAGYEVKIVARDLTSGLVTYKLTRDQ